MANVKWIISLSLFVSRKRRVWARFHPGARRRYFPVGFRWKESNNALWSEGESTTHVQVWHIFVCLLIAVLLFFLQLISLIVIHLRDIYISHAFLLSIFSSWYINGTEVDADADYRYSFIDGNLIISNASEITDFGRYQCKAENGFGTILSRDGLLQFACEYQCYFHSAIFTILSWDADELVPGF